MNRDAFDQAIHRNWAAHFGCPVETLHHPGTTVLPLDRYAGQKLVALWYVGEHAFICNVNNLGSHGVALGLNFQFYFRQESLWLA